MVSSVKVTVIVPVYNVEKYVARCLDCLAGQDFDDCYEILIINDGAKDSSPDIAREYCKKYPFMRMIGKENGGLSSARNMGIRHARGEFIAFVDSDDYVTKDYISKLYSAAVNNNADIVCCNYFNTDEKDRSAPYLLNHPFDVMDGKTAMKAIIIDVTVRTYTWNKLYRKSLFTDNGIYFPEGMTFEDVACIPRLFYYARKVACISDVLYYYVHRKGSITGNISVKSIADYLRAFAILRQFIEEKQVFGKYKLQCLVLSKKISVTVFGMLVRCKLSKREKVKLIEGHVRASKFLKVYGTKKYYFAGSGELDLNL